METCWKRLVGGALLFMLGALSLNAQITPSDDAYANTATPTTNFGAKITLGVVSPAQTAYIRFDLSSIPTGATSASISKATLKLFVNTVPTAGSFNVVFINGTWSEKTITANLAPALGTTIAASIPLTGANSKDYVLVDVTSALGSWLDGTQANDGLALVANSPLSATIESKENTAQGHSPELDIVFSVGGDITGITTAAGSGLIGGANSGVANLSLLNTCSSGQVLSWNGTAWACKTVSGSGTVTSVGLSAPASDFTVSGSPVTASGTLGLNWAVAPTSANTANAIVKRDATGSFNVNSISGTGTFATTTGTNKNGIVVNASRVDAVALQSNATAASGQTVGVIGVTASPTSNAIGVWGVAQSSDPGAGFTQGVAGTSNSPLGIGVIGFGQGGTTATLGGKIGQFSAGVWGDNRTVGVAATSDNGNALVAVNNDKFSPTVYVESNAPDFAYLLYANSPVHNAACYFTSFGDLHCDGVIVGAAKFFKIDHPLDPANKYLVHTSIESPDMKTVYDGVAALDANGEAWVTLPAYVEALNGDFRYQLTCIGSFAPVFVAQEITRNQFQIRGGTPGMRVSWQVTGIRHDAWARTHPTTVEEEKSAEERGYYLHPQAFGQPGEKSVRAVEIARQRAHLQAQTTKEPESEAGAKAPGSR